MMRITCDLCGKELPDGAERHVVHIEIFAAHEPALLTEEDLDEDHMEAVSELLRDMEELAEVENPEPATRQIRYDLCPRCRQRFLRDPLGREAAQKFDFSEN
jgi:hypothetical protein